MGAASRFLRSEPRADDFTRRMILRIADDYNPASASFHFATFRDALRRVVRSLGVKIRANLANDGAHILLGKHHHGIHIRERSQNLCALFGRHEGPSFSFQCTDGSIAVDGNHEFSAQFPSGMQIANMADVQQIEAPVSQRDAIAGAAPVSNTLLQLDARNDFRMD